MTIFRLFFSSLFLISCLLTIVRAQTNDEIITVDSSIVLMNAVITDSEGKPVGGLKKNQFKVFEDGTEQEVSIFETQETPFAAVILLDTSGSMEQRISLARSAAINFLDGLRRDDSAAIYNFDTKVSLIQDFSNSRDVKFHSAARPHFRKAGRVGQTGQRVDFVNRAARRCRFAKRNRRAPIPNRQSA
jgi:VWFA-related protein